MRRILVLLSFLVAFSLSAAGVISVSPATPKAQSPVTFTVSGIPATVSLVTWYFGDDALLAGGRTATHSYGEPGRYRVRATYILDATFFQVERWITVDPAYQKGPSAPFNLTSVILRWKDGQSMISVPKGSEGLTGYADIKFEGTGPFQAQWLVDGQVLKTVSQTLSFAGRTTLDSGAMPALYTNILGPHDVTLRILSPNTNFRIPTIRYEVSPAAPSSIAPVIEGIYPPSVHQGDEVELQITGRNFTEDMKPDFGPGITLVSPVTLLSPMSAKVKVFVPPTTKLGFHALSLLKGKDRLASSARLEVLGRAQGQKVLSGSLPCPDPTTFKKGSISLSSPSWQDKTSDNSIVTDRVPTLNDFTIFEWSEQSPGAAQYFELRIYDKTGSKLLITQKLPGGSKKWNTAAGFVPALMNVVMGGVGGPTAVQVNPMVNLGGSSGPGTSDAAKSGGTVPQATKRGFVAVNAANEKKAAEEAKAHAEHMAHLAKVADVIWQIVGLREYICVPAAEPSNQRPDLPTLSLPSLASGTSTRTLKPPSSRTPADTTAPETKPEKRILEVEASEFWPLKLPEQAKGITQGSCSMMSPGTTLSAVKISGSTDGFLSNLKVAGTLGSPAPASKSSSGASDMDMYPGDVIQLSGNFTLAASPYGFLAKDVKTPPAQGGFVVTEPTACTLDNVFVDWGDGTGIQPLAVQIKTGTSYMSGSTVTSGAVFIVPAGPYRHAYQHEGKYNVRVFMLSEDDVQLAGLKDASASMATKGQVDSSFLSMVKVASGFSGDLQAAPTGGSPKPEFAKIGGMQLSTTALAATLQAMDSPSLQQLLARAYVVFCDSKDIRPFKDHCALKPLELVSVDLSFPSEGGSLAKVNASRTKTLGGPAASPSSGNAVQKAQLRPTGPLANPVTQSKPGSIVEMKADAVTNACNEAFTAKTVVRYHGQGLVKVTWKVDGEVVCESQPVEATTKERTGLTKAQAEEKDCSKVPPSEIQINMPDYLPVSTPGFHILTAEAQVVPNPQKLDLEQFTQDLVSLNRGGKRGASPTTLTVLSTASNPSGSPKVPKIGVLNPAPVPGMPHMAYINDVAPAASKGLDPGALSKTAGGLSGLLKQPPFFVESGRKVYKVDAADPTEPCSIDFPTKNGSFRVTDLAKNVKTEVVGGVTRMTGNGKLKVALRASDDTVDERLAVPVSLAQWEVDGLTVTKGEVNVTGLSAAVNLPGTKGTLDSVKGKVPSKGATQDLLAQLTLKPADATLTLRGNESQVPSWTVEKPLSSEGDFYADSLNLPETFVGRTPWIMQSQGGVVLDYSHKEGAGPVGQGNTWVGVRLKKLSLKPFSFQLVNQTSFPLVDTWYLGNDGGSTGLHGVVDFQNWEGKFQEGSIKVGTMHFEALGGQNYKAVYKNTEVQVPWFPTPVKGDIAMSKSGDGFVWNLEGVKAGSMPTVVNGGFSLKPANLYFTNEQNIAWTVMGDAILDFKADGRPFASFTLDRFCYRFDGRASFEKDIRTRTVPINVKTTLGDTQADIRNVTVTMPTSGDSVVNFDFNTSLRLSDSPLLPAADVVVGYRLNRSASGYAAPPAATAPFELAMAFPMGSPSVNGKIHPVYAPSSGGGASTRYTGSVDLGMFGGPPFKTQFVLGYQGSKDYFLCRADIPLGPSGVVLYPELLMLYKIHGGFGYNFGLDAFKDNVSILNAQPDMKGNALFSAGMRVGSADSFAYMLDGTLTISTAGAARMDYDAWLLTTDHDGQGQFKGWFQYANKSFDGKLWGGLNMLGGLVQFSLGNSEANAAVDLHMASDSWHIYAGQKNGQRIKAKVITSESDSYLMLGSKEGFAIGGAQNYYLGVGDSSVASAYAKAYLDMGLQVTPQPKIIGDFGAGMSAGVCVFGVCVSGGVNAAVHAEALPVNVRASCNLDLPFPLSDVDFTVHM